MGKLIKIQEPDGSGPKGDSSKDVSVVAHILAPATKETRRFLEDICFAVSYKDYCTRLKLQVFERCRGLALSDEFEEVDDMARQMALNTSWTLDEYRALPEYLEMRLVLRHAAENYSYDGSGRDWVDKHMPIARRELIRNLRDGGVDSSKILVEMLERDVPKISRNADHIKKIALTPEQAQLIADAIQQAGVAIPKELLGGEDKK